jgi:hypothetical protein
MGQSSPSEAVNRLNAPKVQQDRGGLLTQGLASVPSRTRKYP